MPTICNLLADQPVDSPQKLVFIEILINIQVAAVLKETWLGVSFFPGRKAANRAGHLDQRQSRDVAHDVDSLDARLEAAVKDRQDFLRRDRREIAGLRCLPRKIGCGHRTSLYGYIV